VAALDSARDALRGGDARDALARLEDFDRRFPHGVLAQEAEALRIETLAKQGEDDVARALAERFLRDHPTSPHASRMRLLLAR
jgi:outer membrane protein assembly factor BamD (BamD/ComL family)